MPQKLDSLKVNEVSVCDFPANASIDPRTGKKIAHSRVAIFKRDTPEYVPIRVRAQRIRDQVTANGERLAELLAKSSVKRKDDPGTQDVDADDVTPRQKKSKKKGKKMPKLKTILKSAAVQSSAAYTSDDLYQAVQKRARKIALKKNCSVELAEGRIWEEIYKTSAVMDPPELRRQPKMMRATKSEAELDRRARSLQKANAGLSYAEAASKALEQDPSLYTKYTEEISTPGAQYLVPESSQPDFSKIGKDDADGCPQCGEDVDDDDTYCAGCGKKLPETSKRH